MKKIFRVLSAAALMMVVVCNTAIAQTSIEQIKEWHKAANEGKAWAQFNLGVVYDNGENVAKDKRKAAHWYRKAAVQGEVKAQYILGIACYNGEGVTENKNEAVLWWRKAAEQGHAGAQSNLSFAYYSGTGIVTDKRESYIWSSIAKVNGNERAANQLSKTNWHEHLSQAEIHSAQKEAAQRLQEIQNR